MPTDENFAARGFCGPSICSLCSTALDSTKHISFECNFVIPIWNWLLDKLQFAGTINKIMDCFELMLVPRSPQDMAIVLSIVYSFFYQVWRARNSNRFDGKIIHWKSCITHIMARAKWVGDNTRNTSNNSISSFSILKGMHININPRRLSSFLEILWCLSPIGWVKANIDGVARGDPVLMACGGIFRDNNATHLGSFCDYTGEGNSELVELWTAMLAVQKAVNMGWRKLWIETDCMLVVKAFSDPALVPWRIRSRWLSCHAYSQRMEFMVSHIYREANFCADYLSNIGHTCGFFVGKVLYYIFLTIPSDQYMQTKLSNMEKLMKPLVVILFLFLSVHDVSLARTKKSENKMNYIVHVSKSTIPTSFNHPSIWYKSILKSVSQSAEVLYSYDKAINGFSTSLSDEELELLKRQYGILKVTPDKKYKLHTTRTPKFLGLDKIANLFPTTNKSNDVIVGVIDSGVWPESKSFDDTGFGPIPHKWKGKCETGTNFTTSNCNKKLIGARFFAKGFEASWGPINETILYRSPRDDLGHGTHTASTAIGSTVENTSFFGYAKGTASGMAIGARVAVYKVCWKTSCMDSDILAGIDQAIADNVNILSLSLGGSKNDYFKDGITIGAFAAMEHGILVSCSAGNSGPTPFKVDNVAPWITTVGAGTLDRDFPAYVSLGNGKNYSGVTLYKGNGLPDTLVPIIYAGNASKGEVRSAELCYSHSLAPEKVAGKIVLCDRGDLAPIFQGDTVKSAGGLGMVLANSKRDGESPLAYAHIFPATSVSFTYGKAIKNYLFSDQNSTATIVFRGTKLKVKPSPMVADFSSRGPNSITPQILKPDIIAPGVNIIAAYSKSVSPTFWAFDPRRVDFNILSGTSMACPHVSGLAALIKSIHPDWSPAVIRSALMTTAYTTYKNNQTLLDSATNKPSTPFEFGAGHVNPISALNPGLVYDLTTDDYLSFLCALNYSSVNIEIVARRKYTCDLKKQYSVTNLNYPSFVVVFKSEHDKIKHTRTLTNVGAARTYKVSVKSNVASIKILVEPKVLSFKKNEKKSYVVTFTTSTLKQNITHSFGSLEWFDGKTLVRSPIAFSWKLH
ncbi:subtilisin-like protease SBT1.7 [Vicia villosa]|uniref:subtilisin-like protease SBT1.7 n=1 Tax=Vicia villosa TaxID=3911 RepID=UPI00273CC2DC|nr:subtilisin-like protease SBT1.7 [Vicia villosa]